MHLFFFAFSFVFYFKFGRAFLLRFQVERMFFVLLRFYKRVNTKFMLFFYAFVLLRLSFQVWPCFSFMLSSRKNVLLRFCKRVNTKLNVLLRICSLMFFFSSLAVLFFYASLCSQTMFVLILKSNSSPLGSSENRPSPGTDRPSPVLSVVSASLVPLQLTPLCMAVSSANFKGYHPRYKEGPFYGEWC